MYKSLYDYYANGETQISIKEGETFEFLEECNEHWWTMRSYESGKVGLVPISYLTEIKQTTNMVRTSFLILFMIYCIYTICSAALLFYAQCQIL